MSAARRLRREGLAAGRRAARKIDAKTGVVRLDAERDALAKQILRGASVAWDSPARSVPLADIRRTRAALLNNSISIPDVNGELYLVVMPDGRTAIAGRDNQGRLVILREEPHAASRAAEADESLASSGAEPGDGSGAENRRDHPGDATGV